MLSRLPIEGNLLFDDRLPDIWWNSAGLIGRKWPNGGATTANDLSAAAAAAEYLQPHDRTPAPCRADADPIFGAQHPQPPRHLVDGRAGAPFSHRAAIDDRNR